MKLRIEQCPENIYVRHVVVKLAIVSIRDINCAKVHEIITVIMFAREFPETVVTYQQYDRWTRGMSTNSINQGKALHG